jgi:ubiquinone biosynthesis protein UbiJ
LIKQPPNLAKSGVNLVGSTQLLQQWQSILQTLDIDWENAISNTLGDIAGPMASSGIKKSADYAKEQWREQGRLLAEYLPEELKLTPIHAEAEHFYKQVDKIKLDVDRMNARLQALQEKITARNNTETPS